MNTTQKLLFAALTAGATGILIALNQRYKQKDSFSADLEHSDFDEAETLRDEVYCLPG